MPRCMAKGSHCLPCALAAQPGPRGSLPLRRLKDEPERRSDPPLPRLLPVMGREEGAARRTFREPGAQGSLPSLQCADRAGEGSPGRGRVESPALPSPPAQLTDMLPSQEFFGIREGKGLSRGFSQRSCAQSLPSAPAAAVSGTGRRRLQAGATRMSCQAQVPGWVSREVFTSQGRLRLVGWPSAQRFRALCLPAHPSSPKDDQIMRLKQADSPGHGDKPKC